MAVHRQRAAGRHVGLLVESGTGRRPTGARVQSGARCPGPPRDFFAAFRPGLDHLPELEPAKLDFAPQLGAFDIHSYSAPNPGLSRILGDWSDGPNSRGNPFSSRNWAI